MRREWDHELRYWKQKGARRAGHRLLCSHPFLLLDAMLESSSRKPWGCLPGPGGLPEQGSRKVDIRHPELNFNFTPLVLFSMKEGEFPRGKGCKDFPLQPLSSSGECCVRGPGGRGQREFPSVQRNLVIKLKRVKLPRRDFRLISQFHNSLTILKALQQRPEPPTPFFSIQLLGADLESWRCSPHTDLLLANCVCPGKPALEHLWSPRVQAIPAHSPVLLGSLLPGDAFPTLLNLMSQGGRV